MIRVESYGGDPKLHTKSIETLEGLLIMGVDSGRLLVLQNFISNGFPTALQCPCKRAAKGLQERVYPETEVKVEGCDEQEDLKKKSLGAGRVRFYKAHRSPRLSPTPTMPLGYTSRPSFLSLIDRLGGFRCVELDDPPGEAVGNPDQIFQNEVKGRDQQQGDESGEQDSE